MFSKTLVVIALASLSLARMTNSRRHMNVAEHQRREKPSTYAEGYLEPYDTYHTRYLAVGCKGQQGTTFFDDCCHPMLATESLANNRKAYCNPANKSASSSSSAAAAATPTTNGANDDSGDDDCEDGSDGNDDGNGDDDETCEDGGDDDNNTPVTSSSAAPVTSSSAAPITSSTPAPAPTTTHKATSTSSKKSAAPTSTSTGGSTGTGSTKTGGFATYFYQGGNAGACGNTNPDTAVVAAIDSAIYSGGSHCGKKIVITNTNSGKSVTVTVADECPTCVNANSIDLSVGAFKQIATESEGMVPISWQWAS